MPKYMGSDWDNLMSGYLDDYGKNEHIDSEFNSLFLKLTRILEKKSSMFWHIKSFQDYIKDINPLGFRVQIFPNPEGLDADFKNAW